MNAILKYFKNLFSSKFAPIHIDVLDGSAKVDAILQHLVIDKKLPGASVSILRNGQHILNKGYGYADIEERVTIHTSNTIFRIASISKCITGLAFGKMVEEGILDWDDSFYKHVVDYPKKKYDFTLRQLASHTAGIRAYKGKEFGLNKPFSIEESLAIFKNDPLVFEPGKGYLYNSFDFVLLSLAMEKASGVPFQDYVKEKILEPLGMTATFSLSKTQSGIVDHQAQPYTKYSTSFKKAMPVNNFYKLAGGGYIATSEDIAKLGEAILNKDLLKAETYKELLTAQHINNMSTYYGLGFQVSEDREGRAFVGHVGSSVGAYSNLFVYPKEKLVVAILVNCTDPKIQETLDEMVTNLIETNTL